MIDIDTEQLQSLMDTLSAANDRIDEAASLLMQITTHTNWNCKERYVINEYTLENRKEIQKLQAASQNFLTAAKSVTNEFIDTESGISEMFSTLEELISRIIANPISSITTNIPMISGIASIGTGVLNQRVATDTDPGMAPSAFERVASDISTAFNLFSVNRSNVANTDLLQSISIANLDDLDL